MIQFAALRRAQTERHKEWSCGKEITLSWRFNELAGEAGEVCNVLKKIHRERMGIVGSRATIEQLAEELADVIICADLCAMTANLSVLLPFLVPISRPFDTLTDAGNMLAVRAGEVSAQNFKFRDTSKVLDQLQHVILVVQIIAEMESIDLWPAIVHKFNKTSFANGLTTTLGEYNFGLTYRPK